MVSEGIAVLLDRIEIDLDKESSRGDSMCSSSVQCRCNIFSKGFHQEWLAVFFPLVVILKEICFKYTTHIHRSLIMLDEAFVINSSYEKLMGKIDIHDLINA